MNYLVITAIYILLEYIDHQINPSKAILNFLQAINKLEILTPNYAVII